VYSTQKYLVFRLFPSSGFLGNINTTFRKLDLFPSSGELGKNIHTRLGPLERANLNHSSFCYCYNEITKPMMCDTEGTTAIIYTPWWLFNFMWECCWPFIRIWRRNEWIMLSALMGGGEFVTVLAQLSNTPWRRMGKWMYRSIFSWPRHWLELSSQLHAPILMSNNIYEVSVSVYFTLVFLRVSSNTDCYNWSTYKGNTHNSLIYWWTGIYELWCM
jgi:hypothetical protein